MKPKYKILIAFWLGLCIGGGAVWGYWDYQVTALLNEVHQKK